MQDLYRQMYLKYAPNLSEEELNAKVAYASSLDKDTFANAFYNKYTGSGPSKEQSQYINGINPVDNIGINADTFGSVNEKGDNRSFGAKLGDAFVMGIDDKVAGLINLFEEIQGAGQDVGDQFREWNETGEWKQLSAEQKAANRSRTQQEGLSFFGNNIARADDLEAKVERMRARQGVFNQTISEDLKDGNIAQAAERIVLGGAESWTSYLSLLSPKALGVLGVSTMGNKWDEENEKDPDRANALLMLNAAGTGAIEFGEGMISRRLLGFGKVKPTQAAKDLTMTAAQRFVSKITKGFVFEGSTEMAQALGTTLWDKATLGYDTKLNTSKKWYQILDEGIIGGFMGGTVSGIQTGFQGNRALEGRAEVLLRSEADNDYIKTKYSELSKLDKELIKSKDPEVKADLNNKINQLSNDIEIKQSQAQKVVRQMRGQGLIDYATNVKTINDNHYKLKKKNLAPDTIKMYQSQISQAQKNNATIYKDHVHKSLNKNLNTSQAYANAAGVEQKVIDNETDYQKAYQNSTVGKKQFSLDGFFEDVTKSDGFFDGQGNWYINKNQALKTEAISVGSHELLHGIVKSTIQGADGNLSAEGEKIVKQFISKLSPKQQRAIQRRIDDNYRYQRDSNGKIARDAEGKVIENEFKSYGEEYLNSYSDAIIKREISLDEGVADRLMNFFQSKFTEKGINKNFKDGLGVYNFLKDYNKKIQTGEVDQDLVDMLKEGSKIQGGVMFSNNIGSRRPEDVRTGDLLTDVDNMVDTNQTKQSFQNNFPIELTYLFADENINTGDNEYDDAINAIKRDFDGMVMKGIQGRGLYGKDRDTFKRDVKEKLMIKSFKEFNPEKNESYFGWLTGGRILGYVKGDISNKYKAEYVKSIDEQREGKEGSVLETQIKDTSLNPEELMIQKEAEESREQEQQELNTRTRLGVETGGDLYNDVLDANELVMSTEINMDNLFTSLKETFVSKLTDKFSSLMGIGKKYMDIDSNGELVGGFLFENGQWLVKKIPLRDLVQMEREVAEGDKIFTKVIKKNMNPNEIRAHEKEYGHTENLYYETETQGPTLYEKLQPTPTQLLKFFNPPAKLISKKTGKEVRSSLKGNRKTKLAEHGAIQLGLDGTMQVIDSDSKRTSARLESNKKLLQKEKIALGLKISRNPKLKLSMTTYDALSSMTMGMENPYDIFNSKFDGVKKSLIKSLDLHMPTAKIWYDDFVNALTQDGSPAYLGSQLLGHLQRNGISKGQFENVSEQIVIDQIKSYKLKDVLTLHDTPTNVGGFPDLKISIN